MTVEVRGGRPIVHGIKALRDDVEAVLEYPAVDRVRWTNVPVVDAPWSSLDVFWGFGREHVEGQRANVAFLLRTEGEETPDELLFVPPDAYSESQCHLVPVPKSELGQLFEGSLHHLDPLPFKLDAVQKKLLRERKLDLREDPRRSLAFRTIIKTLQNPAVPKIYRGLGSPYSSALIPRPQA